MKRAITINIISKFAVVIFQIILNAILSRILSPAEFGIVAVITVFTNLFSIFSDMGISTGIIQHKELKRDDLNNIFTFTMYLGIFLGILFIIFSIFISYFYNNSVYISIGFVLFLSIFFNTLNSVPNGILLKNKMFLTIGIRTVIVTLLCGIITIILAIFEFSFYALLINSILSAILIFTWNYFSCEFRLKFILKINFSSLKIIKNYSSYQFGFSIINYFSRNLDNLLIGKFKGEDQLAFYNKSYSLMLYPNNMLASIITPLLHPIFSEYKDNPQKIYENYVTIIKILSLIGAFIGSVCFFCSEEIILLMYGNQWLLSINSFKILSISILSQMVLSTTGSIYQSFGKTKLLFKVGILNTVITVLSIIIGLIIGNIDIVSIFVTISYSVNLIITLCILSKFCFNFCCYKLILDILKSLIINAGLIISIFAFNLLQINFNSILVSIIFKSIYIFVIFILLIFITKEYKTIFKFIRRKKNEF